MEAFRRIDIDQRYPKYKKTSGRFNLAIESVRDFYMDEALQLEEKAKEREAAISAALDNGRVNRNKK